MHVPSAWRRNIFRVGLICAVLAGVAAAMITTSRSALASEFVYGHSWFITNPTVSALESLGQSDASWANTLCSNNGGVDLNTLTVLDFGRPGINPNSGLYATLDLGGHWDANPTVADLAEDYALYWYSYANGCMHLYLAVGTANDYECQGNSSCNVYTAGQQWNTVAEALTTGVNPSDRTTEQSHLSRNHAVD